MSEYAKMKNADLEALLKSRNLPHTGKKAEMVDRLVKDDEKKKAAPAPAATDNAEDEIDWDDDATEPVKTAAESATTEASATAIKAGGKGPVSNPQAVPNQVADIDPAQTDDLAVKPPAEEGTTSDPNGPASGKAEEEPAVDFTRGLAASSLEDELEKRRKRAAKFGLNVEEDEGFKKLERAKKFGETSAPRGLDEALPERGRKRGREGNDEGNRNKRRGGRFQGRRGPGRDSDRRPPRDDRRRDQGQKTSGGGIWLSDADKAKAEARKNRFAAAPASGT